MRKTRLNVRGKNLLWIPLAFIVSMAMVVPVSASYTTTMSVVPPSIVDTTLGPGSTFSVDVVALNVTNLYLFEFKLWYDTSVLNATGITPGAEFSGESTFPSKMDINDTIGLVWVAITRMSPLVGIPGPADVPLAKIDFTVDAWGYSTLNLEDTILGDYAFPFPTPISHDVVDGYFNNNVIVTDHAIVWGAETYLVITVSNSTVSPVPMIFDQPHKLLSFDVTGEAGTTGFCNVTIPNDFLWATPEEPWVILVDEVNTTYTWTDNGTHSSLYFTYEFPSTLTVQIIGTGVVPEFPTIMIVPLLFIATLTAVILGKKVRSGKRRGPSVAK